MTCLTVSALFTTALETSFKGIIRMIRSRVLASTLPATATLFTRGSGAKVSSTVKVLSGRETAPYIKEIGWKDRSTEKASTDGRTGGNIVGVLSSQCRMGKEHISRRRGINIQVTFIMVKCTAREFSYGMMDGNTSVAT